MSGHKRYSDLFFLNKEEIKERLVENWLYDQYKSFDIIDSPVHGFNLSENSRYSKKDKAEAIKFLNTIYKGSDFRSYPYIIGFSKHKADESASFWAVRPQIDDGCEVIRVKDNQTGQVHFIPTIPTVNIVLKKDPKNEENYFCKVRFATLVKVDEDNVIYLPMGQAVDWAPMKFGEGYTYNPFVKFLTLSYQLNIESIFNGLGKGDPILRAHGHGYNMDFHKEYKKLTLEYDLAKATGQNTDAGEKLKKMYDSLHADWHSFCENCNVDKATLKIIDADREMLFGKYKEVFEKKYAC